MKYKGYKEIILHPFELADFYSKDGDYYKLNNSLLENQYLSIYNEKEEFVDLFVKKGGDLEPVLHYQINSNYFGKLKPKDEFQRMALDSLNRNDITLLSGPAGSGKSLVALAYLFQMLENNEIDHIDMFTNPIAVMDAARLGYTPGSLEEKQLDSQIGNILTSKIGGRLGVEQLLAQDKLRLIPFSNLRGYETGKNTGVFITEAQNLNVNLMKIALTRITEGAKVIIEGDPDTQLDMLSYEGDNNGMRRMSEIFKGHDKYGQVEFKKVYRSWIADLAQQM